ncbi:MAG: sensor domain-containing diguanylate cyclase [Planctomycetes bacterium]|nr:sensor domain-containing diguanylate cyclase [Planctomycetota bacterium]
MDEVTDFSSSTHSSCGSEEYRTVPKVEELPHMNFYSSEELRAMGRTELVSHTVRLQQVYQQVGSDYSILKWEYEDYKNNMVHLSGAVELAHMLNASDLDSVISIATNQLPEYLNCSFAALYFYNPDSKVMELQRSTRPTPEIGPLHRSDDSGHFLIKLFFHRNEPFVAKYIDESTILIADDEEKIVSRVPEKWHELLGGTCLVFPLQVAHGDQPIVLGGLIIGSCERPLDAADAEMSVILSDLLTSSLYNAKLVNQLNEMTIIDPLTQVYNRRHLLNQLTSAMLNANRYGNAVSIAMMDIDHFKRFNDTYGHICGDLVLRDLGGLLKSTIRHEIDVPARYGGEEFIIVMPYIRLADAVRAGERLRQAIKEHVFVFGERSLNVTCSFGIAEYVTGESVEKFIDRADAALYRAKKQGRDRVVADQYSPMDIERECL